MVTNNSWNAPALTANGQLIIGQTGANPVAATLTAGTGITIANNQGGIVITAAGAATFIEDDGASAIALTGRLNLKGSAVQGLYTTGTGNTVTFSMYDWTTVQKGVGKPATNALALTGTDAATAITPQALQTKLGTQALYTLPVSSGTATAITWLGPLTNGQILIGSTNSYPVPATLTAGTGISITNNQGGIVIGSTGNSVSYIEDDGASAIPITGVLNLKGSAIQGLYTTGAGNTVTFSMYDWTTVQKGVGKLATNALALTGTDAATAITPQGLQTKLGTQALYTLPISSGTATAITWLGPLTNGQILIGSTNNYPVPATLTAGSNITITNNQGGIVIASTGTSVSYIEDDGASAIPISGLLNLKGSAVQGLYTTGSGNTVTFSMYDWTTVQKGVGKLATNALALTGTDAATAITPQGLQTKLGTQALYTLPVSSGTATALTWLGPLTNGQFLIGSTNNYPVPGTITSTGKTLVVTPGAGTIDIETQPVLQTDTGFGTWSGAAPYFIVDNTVATTASFTVSQAGTGFINGVPVSWAANQKVSGLASGTTNYIYIDSTGTIQSTATRTEELYEDNIVLFECLVDSATPHTVLVTKENHEYGFPVQVSNYCHDVIGTVIENINNGANISTVTGQPFQVGILVNDFLNDHGLETTITATAPAAGVVWNQYYYLPTSGLWASYTISSSFTGVYASPTTGITPITPTTNYGIYTLYVTKDNINSPSPIYIAVLDITTYTSLSNANTALANGTQAQASGVLQQLELCQLGYMVYRRSTPGVAQLTISKSTLKQTLSTGGSNSAALITTNTALFDGILSASDSNVQAALNTIDQWPVWQNAAGPTQAMGNFVSYVANSASLVTFTLPTTTATAGFGKVNRICGRGAGGWKIDLAANSQTMVFGNYSATISVSSVNAADCIELVCSATITEWTAVSAIGNIAYS